MNVIPWIFRTYTSWGLLRTIVNARAIELGYQPYEEAPDRYAFRGWGLRFAGLTPVVSVYVTYDERPLGDNGGLVLVPLL